MSRQRNKIRRKKITVSGIGDIGPQTLAQIRGSEVVMVEGQNPNGIRQKRRDDVLTRMHMSGVLSMRQYQAGQEIQEAFCACERLSSGESDYSRPIVDSSPKPDRFTDMQVDAHSRLNSAMRAVPSISRDVVEHVCWHNKPIAKLAKGRKFQAYRSLLQVALDNVATRLNY